MPCIHIFMPIFLLFFFILASQPQAMEQEECNDCCLITHPVKQKEITLKNTTVTLNTSSMELTDLPEDMVKEFFNCLASKEVLLLRATSKQLKKRIDKDFWENHPLVIRSKSSSPAVQEIQNIPCHTVSLIFEKWQKKDLEPLLAFKHVTHLHLSGLQPWDFSINDLFYPYSSTYLYSCLKSLIGIKEPIFSNVTSLNLSGSKIGDYGVTSFVSQFKNLRTLNISKNNIGNEKEEDSKALGSLISLTSLDISYNQFSGIIIQDFTQLKNLTFLDISYNFISHNKTINKLKQQLPKLTQLINSYQSKKPNDAINYAPSFGAYYHLRSAGSWMPGQPLFQVSNGLLSRRGW